jgi:invasion protein IalB
MKSDDKDAWSADIPWVRCITGACFAEIALTDADLIRWHALDSPGKLIFKDASGRTVAVGFSFHGLGQALDSFAQHQH